MAEPNGARPPRTARPLAAPTAIGAAQAGKFRAHAICRSHDGKQRFLLWIESPEPISADNILEAERWSYAGWYEEVQLDGVGPAWLCHRPGSLTAGAVGALLGLVRVESVHVAGALGNWPEKRG
jgi:hypothetical protein